MSSPSSRRVHPLAVAQPEQQHDALGVEPPGGEQQRLARRLVEPLQVVGDRQHRLALGRRASRLSTPAATAKRSVTGVASSASAPPIACACTGGISARRSSSGESSSEQRGERQLGLRLDPARPQHAHAVGAVGGVAQQRRLAHPCLAVDEQRGAAPLARRLDHAPEPGTLLVTSDQQGWESMGARAPPRASHALRELPFAADRAAAPGVVLVGLDRLDDLLTRPAKESAGSTIPTSRPSEPAARASSPRAPARAVARGRRTGRPPDRCADADDVVRAPTRR